jgi:PmbA protein
MGAGDEQRQLALLGDLAQLTLDHALAQGASEAAVSVGRSRFIDIKRRQGQIEVLKASTSRGLSLALYVDGRYSSNSTSFLEPDDLRTFVDETLKMTRMLAADPFRALPDPALYGPTEGVELELEDPSYDDLDMPRREALIAEVEQAAQAGEPVISVASELVTASSASLQLHSNGFRGARRGTSFTLGATVTARDEGDRRPEDHWWTVARHLEDLPAAQTIGAEAARRALARLGSRKVKSATMPLLVENRAAGRLVGSLLEPLSGAALQQRRSCMADRLGQRIGSDLLTLTDQPLRRRGLGSRTYDGEGLKARGRTLVDAGSLQSYLIDVYYGRKLEREPTSGSTSNLILTPGEQSLEQLIAGLQRGVLVTGFLGGNSNPATGDFSFGVSGFLIEDGALAHPVSEMNITGSHTKLWHRLAAVGSDPYPYSSRQLPSLLFEDVQFSGV